MRGKVFFVGAGAGAIDLLTVRAVRVLERADVVLHDDLVPREFGDLVSPRATVCSVGKRCGAHGISQDAIDTLMIHHARLGRLVVRLKCGDPSLFGRLGEEIDALREAHVDFEIIPGVTAAVAAAAAAQVSLTDRRFASRVIFAAATLADGKRQDWKSIATPDTTLVIYMPGRDRARLAAELMQAGLGAGVPCAVIANAGSADEAVLGGTLADLHSLAAPAPVVVIVGEVVRALDHPALQQLAASSSAGSIEKENAHV